MVSTAVLSGATGSSMRLKEGSCLPKTAVCIAVPERDPMLERMASATLLHRMKAASYTVFFLAVMDMEPGVWGMLGKLPTTKLCPRPTDWHSKGAD